MREKINQILEELKVNKIIDSYQEHEYYYYNENNNRVFFYDYYLDYLNLNRKVRIRETTDKGYYLIEIYLTFITHPTVTFGGRDLKPYYASYGGKVTFNEEWFVYKEQVKLEDISNEIKTIKKIR